MEDFTDEQYAILDSCIDLFKEAVNSGADLDTLLDRIRLHVEAETTEPDDIELMQRELALNDED